MSRIVVLMVSGVGPVCGLEVFPEVPSEEGDVVLQRPVMVGIVPGRTAQDKGQLGFNPYLEFTNEFESGITFVANNILHVLTPLSEVENAYRAHYTDSGLVLPPTGGSKLHRV